MNELAARKARAGRVGSSSALRFAAQDMLLYSASASGYPIRVHALSPSTAAELRSINDLAKMVLPSDERRLRVPALEPNDASVVLWIEFAGTQALFGADLETTSDVDDGWAGVINSGTRPAGRGSVYKVAHHGSSTGHHDGIHAELLEAECLSILTPWRRGRHRLPTDEDRARICTASGLAFTTVKEPGPTRRRRRDPAVERTLREMGVTIRTLDPQMGHIQLRRRPEERAWRVALAPVSGPLCA